MLFVCSSRKDGVTMSETNKLEYIQVGVTAARDPLTGGFLPAVPLYIAATDAAQASADKLIEDIQGLLAARYAAYVDSVKAAGFAVP